MFSGLIRWFRALFTPTQPERTMALAARSPVAKRKAKVRVMDTPTAAAKPSVIAAALGEAPEGEELGLADIPGGTELPTPIVGGPSAILAASTDQLADRICVRIDGLIHLASTDTDRAVLKSLRELVRAKEVDLPRFPTVARELMTLAVDSPQGGKRIAELVRQDLDTTARVLQLARSAMYGKPVKTLAQAVTRLGVQTVRQVAIGVSMQGVVYRVPGYQDEAAALREQAFQAGLACSRLMVATKRSQLAGVAFLAGMFHDVGHVLLLMALSKARRRTRGGRPSTLLLRRLRRELHVPLGTWYALERELPESVAGAVAAHHEPEKARTEDAPFAWAVWAVQHIMASRMVVADPQQYRLLEIAWPEEAPVLKKTLKAVGISAGGGRAAA